MLYLIKSRNFIKIGYTDNLHTRMQNYRTHNPEIEILGFRFGDLQLEKYYHHIFRNRRVKQEWFDIPDYIISYLMSHHFTITDEYITDKIEKKKYNKEEKILIPDYIKLLKSLYTKIIITRITNDLNNLQFTSEEESLLTKYRLYDPELKRLRRGT